MTSIATGPKACKHIKMADSEEYEVDGKPLSELRVVDLKQELDKRGLSKSGSKRDLTDRLKIQIQIEDLQQRAKSDEGHVPNLAMQDGAIGEQSDVVKEYLAKQQQIFELQKEERRRVELAEEALQRKSEEEAAASKESTDSSKDIEPETAPETAPTESRKGGAVEAMGTAENSSQLTKEHSRSPDQQEKITDVKTTQDGDQKSNIQAAGDGDSSKGKELSDVSAPEKMPDDADPVCDSTVSGSDSVGNNSVPAEHATAQVSQRGSRSSTEEATTPTADVKETRSTRPRIRREFFLPEPDKESSCEAADLSSGNSTRRARSDVKDNASKATQENRNNSGKVDSFAAGKQSHAESDALRSASKDSPSNSESRRSSDVKKRRGSSSSSSSGSSSSSKNSRSRSGSSHNSSKHGSRSSSSSSSRSSKSQERRRSRSRSESPRTRKEPTSSKTSLQQKKHGQSGSPQRSEKKRRRSDDSRDENKEKVNAKPAIVDDNTEDVITTLAEEEIDSKLDADVPAMSEANRKQLGSIGKGEFMDVDEKTERTVTQDADKEESSKMANKVHMRKISISSSKENQVSGKDNDEPMTDSVEKPVRKRKWGSSAANTSKKTSISISTDSLKTLIPDVKPLATLIADTNVDLQEDAPSEPEHSPGQSSANEVRIVRTVTQLVVNESTAEESMGAETITQEAIFGQINTAPARPVPPYLRPLSMMEEPVARTRSPSPARNPPTRIVHIRNLVRPFTLKQLKDLLARTGTLVEGGFWIDKIKSKCYATYETDNQAIETRHALHGTQWPPSNRKNLIVDYADEDELKFHMSLTDIVVPIKSEPYVEPPVKELVTRRVREMNAPLAASVQKIREQPVVPPPIREWDRDKIGEKSPGEKERRRRSISPLRDRRRDRERDRVRAEPKERRERKVERRKEEEEAPAKLLDDLFRKTKAVPCIYWLPLTLEQTKKRDEERKQREIEREKRLQQAKLKREQQQPPKEKPNAPKDAKKPRTESDNRRRRRSGSAGGSRNRKR